MKTINSFVVLLLLCLSLQVQAADSIDKQCVPEGSWVTKQGHRFNNQAVFHSLSNTNVVLLGEDHDNPEHHRWQLHTIAQLYAHQPDMAIGFESFPRAAQKYLDQWVAGEISENEFFKAVEWDRIWMFNKDFYLPMFHFARMNDIPMYALNVERSLVSQVSQKGWENIPVDQREGVTDPAPASEEYINVLAEVFAQHMPKGENGNSHGHGHADDASSSNNDEDDIIEKVKNNPAFLRFTQGQLVWDRSMAEVIHKAIKSDNKKLVVGVLGAGHIFGDYGVPNQLNSLGVSNIKTLMAWDGSVDCKQLKEGAVDLAYGVSVVDRELPMKPEEKPRLGVYLDHSDGVIISKLVKGSVAEKTGILVDDKIVNIAGKSVGQVSDVVNAVKKTAFGTWLPMTIMREGKKMELVAKFPAR